MRRLNVDLKTKLATLCVAVFAAAMIIALIGCGGGNQDGDTKTTGDSSTANKSEKTIGVSLLTMQHQFYQDLRAGLEARAKELGYKLIITSAEFDSSRQANQIDEFLVQDVDAIVVCPCDSKSVGASIAAANEKHIPVVTADIASTSTVGEVRSHIASDNVAGGREAARLMAEALHQKGKVAILSQPEVTSVSDRVDGFREQIRNYGSIDIVAELSAGGRRDRAVSVMEDLLQSNPDLNGVFAINDDSALGALAAIEAAGKAGQLKIIGYDATPEARAAIEAGKIHGDVIQFPRKIGELTMNTIDGIFHGEDVPSVVPVEVGRYTKTAGQ